jgi:formylglycine-generating enzyme required for sulfatase activity
MIFVSYSHLDRKWFDRDHPFNLIPWLENALRRDGVTLWYDRSDEAGLQPGDRFEQEITEAVGQADVALLLISEAFFSSDFIRTVELPRILARAERGEMVVIPVLLEPCDWQSFDFVAARQMLPGAPTPLIDYTETERQWAHARDEILSGIRRRIRSVPPTVVAPSRVPRPLVALPRWAWVALFLALAVLAARARIWPLVRPTVKPTPTQIAQGQQTPTATAVRATRPPAATPAPAPSRTQALASTATLVPSAVAGTPVQAVATKVLEPSGITLVYVPAGEFLMGSADTDTAAGSDEKPQHTVYLDGYWIGQTEVTNAQFGKFMDAGGYSRPEYWTDEGWQWKESATITQPLYWTNPQWNKADDPVVGVSWYEAAAYAQWAGARLPTEAEWEYAARGGPLSRGYVYAGGNNVDTVAWYGGNSEDRTHGVGGKAANELGLYDMSGNVWECCEDWYGENYYAQSPRENPRGPLSGLSRVLRGGSWFAPLDSARCAFRGWSDPVDRGGALGFRVAE